MYDVGSSGLKEELGFVAVFDHALAGVRDMIDMPDRRASLFVTLCMQNGGFQLRNVRGSPNSSIERPRPSKR
jgi:hypothetical protein